METVRTQIENFITNGDLQSAIYKLIEHVSTPSDSNYLCTLWGELTRTELDRSLIDYEDYNRTKNRITKSLLAFLAQLELKETAISVKKGYAVHNIPSSLVLGKKILCEVKISDEQIETVKTKFKRILNDVYLRDDMEVKLTSDDGAFTIEPLNSLTLQSIISGEINSWKFWLTGNKDGKHVLVMTITGINKDVFSKSNKREDVTVVKIAVTMSREQNLVPEIAPPIYQPTNIYYGYVSSTQNVFVYVVKSGVAQIAIIVGVVLLVGIPGFQRAFFNNRLADEKEIVLPIDDIGQSTIEIVGTEQARIEQDAENKHILVVQSDVDNFTGYAIVTSISKSHDELFEVNIKGLKSGNPVLAYKLIDSSHALLLLKLTDNCVFHKPNVMIGNDRYLNWKLIDEQTILLKDDFTKLKDKIKVLDTLFTNNRIDKVLLNSSNLTNKRNTENVLYMDCPLQLYDFIQVNLKLKDFNNLNGTINVYDTSQFKFSVNGKINKGFRFMGDTIKHILFANKRYFFKVSYIKAPNDSFVSDMVDTFLLNHTNTITLNFRNVNLKKIKDTSATVTLNFPNKFFTKPVITLDKGEKINLVSINNKSLKLLLPLDKTFNIYVKEGNHLGYAKVTTNTGLIDKDFICQSLAYEIRFKLSNKLRHLQQSIAVKRKSGEVNVKFDKDFCIVKFYNANKADGFEQIDLTLPHDNLRICCFKGKLTAGQVKEWNCGEFCRACEEKTKTQAAVKQKAKK